MAYQLFGYKPAKLQATEAGRGGESAVTNPSSVFSSRSAADPYTSVDSTLLRSSRNLVSDLLSSIAFSIGDRGLSMLYNHSDAYSAAAAAAARISSSAGIVVSSATPHLASQVAWSGPPGVDIGSAASMDPLLAGIKRPSDCKRLRFESASNLPIYPQRPGEKDCVHYMQTRTCKFGDSCIFDHPIWVPEGGIPEWKEVALIPTAESLPERPGEPDCPYFLKTQRCKYGPRCKFNHPKEVFSSLGAGENPDAFSLPERPSEPPCAFYLKTGNCKFGATCKFHHPKDILIQSSGQENGSGEHVGAVNYEAMGDLKAANQSFVPALFHNSKGLPIRLGELDCPFYLKTGSCKYGATCRYNHPDRNDLYAAINPPASVFGSALAANFNIGGVNPAASILQTIDPRLAQTTIGLGQSIYPQRPGQHDCDFYIKTGECKFGERCKFHHPIDRSGHMKLTLAGLPRREGAIHCPYYMKTGACKYGILCKFDHPPPGEVMASSSAGGEIEGENDAGAS